jgi:predicted HAD superfamily phosphohydrolase YqeG
MFAAPPRPLTELSRAACAGVVGVLTDIDDTLTCDGAIEPAARQALLQRADNPDPLARRSINIAIDTLSPHGCPECITRLDSIISAEQGQESRSLMNLEQEMLIARLRARAAH